MSWSSVYDATTLIAACLGPAKNIPSPTPLSSSRYFSLWVSKNVFCTKSIEAGDCLRSNCTDELVHDRLAVRRGKEIVDVLGNGSDAQIVFAAAFNERENKFGRVFALHQPPSFVDHQDALFAFGPNDVPNVVDDGVNGDRPQFVLQVAHGKDDKLVAHVHRGRRVDEAGKRAFGIFLQARHQVAGAGHAFKDFLKILHDRRFVLAQVGRQNPPVQCPFWQKFREARGLGPNPRRS